MRRSPVLLAAVLTAFGVAEAASAASRPAARAAATGPVIAPGDGSVVRSHKVRLRVRASDRAGALRATLNGRSVADEFGPARFGVRTLSTSASHGLRRGRNTLRVNVRRSNGKVGIATVRFTIRTPRTLTGAGRNRRVVVGSRSTLVGRGHPRARWRVVSGPGVRRASAAAATSPTAQLTSPADLTAGFRPLEQGRYTVELTAGPPGRVSSDRVTLTAVPEVPLLPIDTMAAPDGDGRGIKVGDTLYRLTAADGYDGGGSGIAQFWLQSVVLDRASLALESNRLYRDVGKLRDDLKRLDEDRLVIVALQTNPRGAQRYRLDGLETALGAIGFPDIGQLPHTPGSLSGIGVPGMKPGDAEVSVAPSRLQNTGQESTYGRIQGYLSPDQYKSYGFVPSQRVPVGYGPATACSAGAKCSVGFIVRILDWKTLAYAEGDGTVYQTGDPSLSAAQQTAQAQAMAKSLATVQEGNLVTIQALSAPDGKGGFLPPVGLIDRTAMVTLANAVAAVGGTRNGFNRIARATGAGASGGMTYALIGWRGAGEGTGAQAAANVNGQGPAPALSGVLRPDRQSRFRPAEVATERVGTDSLNALAMAPPSDDWPLADKAHEAAMRYLSSKESRLSEDPRDSYWTQPWTQSDTTAIAGALDRIAYPTGGDPDFTKGQLDEARTQLQTELAWVGNVRSYLTKLKAPFAEGDASKWLTARTVARKVYEDVHQPNDEVAFKWVEFTEILLHILGPATHEGSAVIASLMELGMWAYGAGKHGEPSVDEVSFAADELGETLLTQAEQAKATIDRIGDIIVSDPKKLALVGRYGGCASGANCPAWLSLSKDDVERNDLGVARGVEALAYEKLLPLGYNVMSLTRVGDHGEDWRRSTDPDVRDYRCSGSYYVYTDYFNKNAYASLLQELDPAGQDNKYDTFAFSPPPGTLTIHASPPSDDMLKRMFSPLSRSGPADAGGLGMDVTSVIEGAKHRTWYRDVDFERGRCQWMK